MNALRPAQSGCLGRRHLLVLHLIGVVDFFDAIPPSTPADWSFFIVKHFLNPGGMLLLSLCGSLLGRLRLLLAFGLLGISTRDGLVNLL